MKFEGIEKQKERDERIGGTGSREHRGVERVLREDSRAASFCTLL
jgi:hypothetical protein